MSLVSWSCDSRLRLPLCGTGSSPAALAQGSLLLSMLHRLASAHSLLPRHRRRGHNPPVRARRFRHGLLPLLPGSRSQALGPALCRRQGGF